MPEDSLEFFLEERAAAVQEEIDADKDLAARTKSALDDGQSDADTHRQIYR